MVENGDAYNQMLSIQSSDTTRNDITSQDPLIRFFGSQSLH